MILYYFSDALLGGFSLIAALISIMTLSLDTTKKLNTIILNYEKNTQTDQGVKELPQRIKKAKKYTSKSKERLNINFILIVICIAIYLSLTLLKSLYPPIQQAAYLTLNINPFSCTFSYYIDSGISIISANIVSIFAFVFSWLQFLLVVIIYIRSFIMIYRQLDIANS